MENKDILCVRGINGKGYGIIPKLVMQDRRLSRDAKCIYAYMRSFSGAGDTAFPGVRKICHDLGFGDEKTFRKHRKQLEDCGYITIEQKQSKETGRFCQNIYIINEYLVEPNTNPENQASSPSGDSSMTVNLHGGKSPSRQNHPTKINSILKLTDKQKQQQQKSCCEISVQNEYPEDVNLELNSKQVKEIMSQYDIEINGSENTLSTLSGYSKEELEKIGDILKQKKSKGLIHNPAAMLVKKCKTVCDCILFDLDNFYPERPVSKSVKKEKERSWTDDYTTYMP